MSRDVKLRFHCGRGHYNEADAANAIRVLGGKIDRIDYKRGSAYPSGGVHVEATFPEGSMALLEGDPPRGRRS